MELFIMFRLVSKAGSHIGGAGLELDAPASPLPKALISDKHHHCGSKNFLSNLFLREWVFRTHAYLWTMCAVPTESKRGIGPSGTGIID